MSYPLYSESYWFVFGLIILVLNRQIQELEDQIDAWHKNNGDCLRLAKIPGVGVLTASALVASIGNARNKLETKNPPKNPIVIEVYDQ